jgi:periplasmic divalent cation tolerance protein
MTDAVVVLCTCASESDALHIANGLVEARLAACVNVLPGLQSVYRWQDRIETAQEVLLLIKTTNARFPALRDRIVELHPYDTPEILTLATADGSDKYLAWLREQVL